ncbi:26S proteasome non-ATPase regulatory subunit 14-like protein [Cucumis melo var. makuwa]|uniref:26S proteasome non-ATPase regulatory subunit 14-like protein n=2 Tax=Cucumis melo TaxID=3656 RepID=A0A5A7VI10_CUCMM|nr:26S proteasome non-ATPase regulatory subunit 14-like protein [Cucumis melo var. makuwa]
MEVMGLMLGEFVDEYTVRMVDVFAMPQSGTGVSVEAVDHVFQTNMLDMLKQTGRNQIPEAALMARSYLPSKVSEIVAIWRKDLSKDILINIDSNSGHLDKHWQVALSVESRAAQDRWYSCCCITSIDQLWSCNWHGFLSL